MLLIDIITDKIDFYVANENFANSHIHTFFELGYVMSGEAEHELNGEKRIIGKGDYYILDLSSAHSYKRVSEEPLLVVNCLFMPEFIDKTLYNCNNFTEIVNNYMLNYNHMLINLDPANKIYKDEDGKIRHLIEDMLCEFENKSAGSYIILRCKLIEIIIKTMRSQTDFVKSCDDELCNVIIKYSQEHFFDKNILGTISEDTHYSVSYLSRRFKEVTGESFSEYIKRIRIEQALKLLDNTNKRVTEIAGICGYSDMKFFNEIFKTQTGMTPRQFRQRTMH